MGGPEGTRSRREADPTGDRAADDAYFVPPGVDPRISLANERTFLAWIRTSLGFMAAGVAVAQVLGDRPDSDLDIVGAGLILFGTVISVLAWRRWNANERRFAARQPLERSHMPGMLTSLMVIVAGAAMILTLWLGR